MAARPKQTADNPFAAVVMIGGRLLTFGFWPTRAEAAASEARLIAKCGAQAAR